MDTMLLKLTSTTAIATAIMAVSLASGLAQTTSAGSASGEDQADACLTAMNEFAARMNEDEFWLSGMSTGGYGAPMAPQSTQAPATVPPAGGTTTTTSPAAGLSSEVDPGRAAQEQMGVDAPRNQIRSLYGAARVLAHRGDAEGCGYLVSQMNEVYTEYSQRMQDAGVDPATVTTWRQEQLALAEPVSEGEGMSSYTVDNITGTNVRNIQDEGLGSVSDVIIDPRSGQAQYIIVARGGFLGIGEDYYAVPWDEVRATPGFDTIVIDRSEAELEQAPSIDPERFRNFETMQEERRSTDQFWTQRA
jgi:sporulation protein YlmC with PRC-barrel domain